jgi:NAD(P)-dependent dehydrogenase (short-subunit alcohol dehydrogenase family)
VAGLRRGPQADADALARASITPLLLDVTDADSVRAAVAGVREQAGDRLDGLVNNAGISLGAPVEFVDLDELRSLFEVNVVGLVATTQAFLPLLRNAPGRIVCIGSISGRFAFPFLGGYAASKHAVEALCDSLRTELRPWHLPVSLVEPGNVDTAIWDKGRADFDAKVAAWPDDAQRLYGDTVPLMRRVVEQSQRHSVPPQRVARSVEHALTARRPRARYLVGADAHAQAILRRLPDRPRDAVLSAGMRLIGRG